MKSLVKVACAALMMALTCTQAHAEYEIIAGGPREANAFFGYSSKQEKFKGQCMTGDLVDIGQPHANVSYSQHMSESEMQQELGMETSGRFSYGAMSASMSAKFLRASTSNSYSLSGTYSGDYRFPNQYLQNPKLSTIGESVVKSPDRFETTCGDEYISQIQRGAKLFFTIRIDFSSEEDKTIFESSFSFNSSMVEAKSKLNAMSKNKNQQANVTVSVYQMGGNVAMLSGIFKGTAISPNGDEALGFVKCTLGDFSQCDGVLARAIEYATDTAKGFPSQLTTANMASLAYETVPYEQAGIYVKFAPGVGDAVKVAQNDLSRLFQRQLKFHVTADYLLNEGMVLLSPQQKVDIAKMDSGAQDNIGRLVKAANVCYDDPRSCTKTLADMNPEKAGGLAKIDDSILEIHPESFEQFCVAAGSPAATQELKQTITALIARAKQIDKSRFYEKDPSDCKSAHLVFMAQEKLDLKNLGLRTVAPLQEFTQLKDLDLSGNQIEDVAPLTKITGLKSLNLSHNSIRSIDELAPLTKLSNLDVSNNVIRNDDVLSKMASLERIDLRNNIPGMACPTNAGIRSCFIKAPHLSAQVLNLGRTGSMIYTPSVAKMSDDQYLITGALRNTIFSVHDQRETELLGDATPPDPRFCQTSTALPNGDVLIAGGKADASLEIYHQDTQVLEVLAAKLSTPRFCHTATVLATGRILFAGGFGMHFDNGALPYKNASYTADIFDPVKKVIVKTVTMSAPRAFHSATVLNDGRVLVAGGLVSESGVDSIDIFDPATEAFTPNARHLETGRGGHTATLLPNGDVLFAGGFGKSDDVTCVFGNSCPLNSAEIWDSRNGSLRTVFDHLKNARGYHTAFLAQNGDVVLTGGSKSPNAINGESKNGLSSVESFQADEESFNLLSEAMSPRAKHAVIPVSQNSFVLVGGVDAILPMGDMLVLTVNPEAPVNPAKVPISPSLTQKIFSFLRK